MDLASFTLAPCKWLPGGSCFDMECALSIMMAGNHHAVPCQQQHLVAELLINLPLIQTVVVVQPMETLLFLFTSEIPILCATTWFRRIRALLLCMLVSRN